MVFINLKSQLYNLGEVVKIINGGTPKSNVTSFWNGDIPWITPKDMGKLQTKYTSSTLRNITEDGLKNSSAKTIPPNSVILSTRAPIGYLAINKVEMSFNQGCKGLIPNNNINSEYLFYFLASSVEMLNKLGTGATFKEISTKKLQNLEIPVPSLQEQVQIAERLNKVFENIDKLTKDVTKNIENSKNLFLSYLNETFRGDSSGDLIELEKLSTYISRGMQPKYTDNSKTLVVNQRCIRDNQINFEVGRYHDQNIKKVSDDKKIQIGDILINSTGVGTLGRVAQVTELPNVDVTVDTHVTIFRPNFNILNKEFSIWLFIYLENLIEKMGVGASGQTELRREDLKNMKIINPPNEKIQQDISEKLNKLKNPYDNYLRLKEDLIIKYSMLRKSILDKEFSYE